MPGQNKAVARYEPGHEPVKPGHPSMASDLVPTKSPALISLQDGL